MTIKLHELPGDRGNKQEKRRVGRGEGSGWGRCAGKGNKGQQARSGRAKGNSFEGGQMPLMRRLPKFGFSNASFRIPRSEVTLRQLNVFQDGDVVDRASLHAKRLISKNVKRVKLICKGKLERKLTLKVQGLSAGAKSAVESSGGTWEIVES